MKLKLANNKIDIIGDVDRFNLNDNKVFDFPTRTADVFIELANMTSVDTAGLAFLLKMIAFYQNKSLTVTLLSPSKQLIALAEISNVLGLLPLKE